MRSSTDVFSHIKDHILSTWDIDCIMSTLQNHLKRDPQSKYSSILFITRPDNDPLFNNATPKPKYWTFVICLHARAPNTLFMGFSDHPDGIFSRIGVTNTIVTSSNILYKKSDDIDKGIVFRLILSSDKGMYIYIEWETGRVLRPIALQHILSLK